MSGWYEGRLDPGPAFAGTSFTGMREELGRGHLRNRASLPNYLRIGKIPQKIAGFYRFSGAVRPQSAILRSLGTVDNAMIFNGISSFGVCFECYFRQVPKYCILVKAVSHEKNNSMRFCNPCRRRVCFCQCPDCRDL